MPHLRNIIPHNTQNWLVITFLTVLFVGAGNLPMVAAEDKVVQIRLTNRHAGDILPMAQPLVSPGGFISADKRSNSLIVIDNPAAIARIRRLVQELDKEVPQLKIRVRYTTTDSDTESDASASAQAKTGDTAVEVGKDAVPGKGVEADLREAHNRTRRLSDYVIRVRSGSIAYIEAGYDVPQRDRWRELSHRYGHISETVTFQRVASGYNIRPFLLDDQVRIEITPRISYLDNRGRDQKIQFTQAATTLFAPLGEWVDIGGVMGGHREINRQILSDSRHAADNRLTMRLMVTID